jgi:AraC family transcriptional regulator
MKTSTRNDYLDRIRRVLRFVQVHLDEPLTPERLAGIANLSVYHFHRIFSGLVGESLGEYVRRMRLERAAGELRRTDRQVVEIALGAGYDAHEPFTRAFRGHFGLPPSAFRRSAEPLVFPSALCGVHYGPDEAVSRFVPLQEDSHMIDVRIESMPARRLLAVAHQGDYQGIGAAFGRVYATAASLGLLGPDTVSLGVYYGDPDSTPAEDLRSHACVSIPPSHPLDTPPDGCELLNLEGGEFAIGRHKGPYRTLHDSYRWLFGQWLPTSGREPADIPVHEIYVNDPRTTPEAELITHICLPLVPAESAASVASVVS